MERKKIGKESEKLFPLIKGCLTNAFLVILTRQICFCHPEPTVILLPVKDLKNIVGIPHPFLRFFKSRAGG